MNNLYNDFLLSKEELRRFYPWLPIDGIEKIGNLIQTRYNFAKENTSLAVLTGQQPAVFGGPLYTIYKIITTIKLSSILNERFSLHLSPIFWLHSLDHDWEEVCKTHFLTYKYDIITFSYIPEPEEQGKPFYKLKINKDFIQEKIIEVFKNVKGSEFASKWQEFLMDSVSNSNSLSDWAVSILREIFKNEQVTIFEPHQVKDFKTLQQVIEIAIENHPLLFEKFNQTNQTLIELGYKPQVHKLPEHAFFFLQENDYRSRIRFMDHSFYSMISQKTYSISELKSILRYEPERFSPNLILRCIYQQMLFPCVIYVGGPAEIAYWAQIKDLLSFFGLPMPIIYPRNRFILLPIKVKKWLTEFKINFHHLSKINEELKRDSFLFLTTSQKEEIEKVRMRFINEAKAFIDNLVKIFDEATLDNYCKIYLSKIEKETEKMIEVFIKSQKNKNEINKRRLNNILNTLLPNGVEQERYFSPFSFIPEYSYEFIKLVMNKTEIGNFDIGIVEL